MKILTGFGQVTEVWRDNRNRLRPIFLGNHVFSHGTCCHWLKWRYYAWFRSADDHIRPMALHFDLLKVIRGHWPFVTPCITELANLAVFGVSWDPETEHVASFSHRHVYSASLHHPKSIRAIDSVCPQAILATTVMPKYSFKGEWVTYPENFSLKIAISQIQVDNFKNYSKHMETNPAFGCCIVFYI